MKVLLVNKFHYRKGGSETYYFGVAEALRQLGHEVFFFAMEDEKNYPCDQAKYFVSHSDYSGKTSAIQKLKDGASLIYSFEAKKKFEALLEDVQPDVIHLNLVHRQLTFSILDAPYLKTHRVPVVFTSHDYIMVCPCYTMVNGEGENCDECLKGNFGPCVRHRCVKDSKAKSLLAKAEADFLRWHKSYEKIDKFIAPSKFMRDKLVQGGIAADKIVYLQNFLTDSQVETCAKVFNPNKFDDADPYFIFFGRLSKEKGVLTLVRAFVAALDQLPSNWKLKLVGDGPQREEIEALIAQEGPEAKARIELLGYRSGEELQRLVAGARFSVMPSEWRENMPYSGMESLAAGTPIVGSDIGGIPELIVEGETGWLFPAGDEHALADALRSVAATSPDEYACMQASCCSFARERCDQGLYFMRLVDTYEKLIENRNSQ